MNDKILQLEKIFPECITEKRGDNGELVKAVNFDLLKQILTENFSDAPETYTFNWVGKTAARANVYRKIEKTLRPCVAESKNFDTTQNLYIEGDNLDALKLLQQSYLHKIKLIYIDPPYNTGKDFIYRDKFPKDAEEYADETNLFDDYDNINFDENTDSNPRFHSDWCSMIFSRLLLARNLLADDGVIFISIDDNEQANLKKICDEVFGEKNWKATFCWRKTHTQTNIGDFARVKEYILCYCKNLQAVKFNKIPLTNLEEYRYVDENGEKFRRVNLVDSTRGRYEYSLVNPKGKIVSGKWMKPKKDIEEMILNNEVYWAGNTPYGKNFLKKMQDKGQIANDFLGIEYGTNQRSTMHLDKLMGDVRVFDFSKPIELLKHFLILATDKDAIILDFFSGSATTAHAVMELNAEDGGKRKFIMVQLPEVCAETSEAYKAGYKNICEIGKERIRRAGEKITADVDTGFRVLKVAETNFKRFKIRPAELTQEKLQEQVENIKDDSTALDLLFECLINWGAAIHFQIESENFEGATILNYNANDLVACFDKNISLEVIKYIAQKNPRRAIFRDACFQSDADKINAGEIFKLYAPNANFKVI